MLSVRPAVKVFMALGAIPMVPMTVLTPTCIVIPVSWRTPMTTGPDPLVVAPSPIPSHPNGTRRRASRGDLYHRSRHWRWYDDWRRGDDNRDRNRHAELDAETNAGVYRGDPQTGHDQNCNSLFHNF